MVAIGPHDAAMTEPGLALAAPPAPV